MQCQQDILGPGYLNWNGYNTGDHRDPIGTLLFGETDFNEECSSHDTFAKDVRAIVLDFVGQGQDGGASTHFCVLNTTIITSKQRKAEWLARNVNQTCLEGSHVSDSC